MKLYGYWRSSASWRVRIALAHKGLSYDNVPVHLIQDGGQQRKADHTQRNPMAQVPVLSVEHGGETVHLTQSLAIMEYLEEVHPEPALLPGAPLARARARALAEVVNAGIQPLQNLSVLQKLKGEHAVDHAAWAKHFIQRGLEALEIAAQSHEGRFLAGDEVSVADICLIPQLYNARRFDVDMSVFPGLLAIEALCEAMPAFQAAHPDQQPDAQ